MQPHVCLINPPTSFPQDPGGLPTGLLSVGSALTQHGTKVSLLDLDPLARQGFFSCGESAIQKTVRTITSHEPDIVGFTAYCSNLPIVLYLASVVKQVCPHVPILLGGPQATMTAEPILGRFPYIDVVVRGEGEPAVVPLVDALCGQRAYADVPSISYRERGRVIHTSQPPLIADLDTLPCTDYSLLDVEDYDGHRTGIEVSLEAGRGCPFACSFCSTSLMWQRKYRMKSVARLYQDMQEAAARFHASHVTLVHDNFTTNPKFVRAFCEYLIAMGSSIEWSCSSRADHMNSELLALMREAGCYDMFFGIETGSWRLQQQIKKRIKISVVKETLARVAAVGIESTASFILGHLDETEDDLNATLGLILDLKNMGVTTAQMHILAAHNGTAVYECVKNKLTLREHSSHMAPIEALDRLTFCHYLVAQHSDIFPSFYQFGRKHFDLAVLHFLQNIGTIAMNHFHRTMIAIIDHAPTTPLELLMQLYPTVRTDAADGEIVDAIWFHWCSSIAALSPPLQEYVSDLWRYERQIFYLSKQPPRHWSVATFSYTHVVRPPAMPDAADIYLLFVSEEHTVTIYALSEPQYIHITTSRGGTHAGHQSRRGQVGIIPAGNEVAVAL